MSKFNNNIREIHREINNISSDAVSMCHRCINGNWNDAQSRRIEEKINATVRKNTSEILNITQGISNNFSSDIEEAERLLSRASYLLSRY